RLDHWVGRNMSEFLALDSQKKVMAQLEAVGRGADNRPAAIEVNHMDGAAWAFPVRYTLHNTGREGRILMLGRDMRPVAELQQRLVRAQAAIEKDYEAQRLFETRFRVLMDATSDAVVLIDVRTGKILDLNTNAAHLLSGQQQGMVGTSFAQEFDVRKRGEFLDDLCRAAKEEDGAQVTARLRHVDTDVTLHPIVFRNAGERVLLCRLSVQSDDNAPRKTGVDVLFEQLVEQYRQARDGMVFIDGDHRITMANEAFLSLMEVDSASELRGRPLADFLSRGLVDLKVLTDDTQISSHPTHLTSVFGTQRSVEITSTSLPDAKSKGGFGLVFRDLARRGHVEEAHDVTAGDATAVSKAMSLVGSAPLRDIVASMTDVLEKQCIEAAVELTNNNRVATAEMLGLSRQSLYVKLRKYGLLQRDER
ncbi:MAG: transcriptional regulator PpsR, partial [Pseudomonadota bacterium]